jgi:hypothetical protein
MGNHELFGEGVATGVLKRIGTKWRSALTADHPPDIEKLISLLSACGLKELADVAENMRAGYFLEIQSRLAASGVLALPRLAIGLLRLHALPEFAAGVESLSGIVTTNHDGLLQKAAQVVYGCVNAGFAFDSREFVCDEGSKAPPVLAIHGSFSWQFGVPPKVAPLSVSTAYEHDTLWIPPTTLKEAKSYPFNRLFGLAYDLLARKCDVLRVVGCSLTQNDWNVLSLIFNAQRHRDRTQGSPFRIELIMPQEVGDDVVKQCSYLRNLAPIGSLTDGYFESFLDAANRTTEHNNPLAYWLKQKLLFHMKSGDIPANVDDELASIAGVRP